MRVVIYVSTLIVLFLFAFTFIVQNPHDTKIYYYFGMAWDGPIATLLFFTLGVGIVFGVLASSLNLLKLKLRLLKVTKQLRVTQSNQSLEREQMTKEGR